MSDGQETRSDTAPLPLETAGDELVRLAGGGTRAAVRFALGVAALGGAIAAYGRFVDGDEYTVISGASLVALGLGGAALLKALFK